MTRETARGEKTEPTSPVEVNLRGHALAPNLGVLRRWMMEMIARGALVELVTAILGLLQRMFEVNTELTARIAHTSRKRPPNESFRRNRTGVGAVRGRGDRGSLAG